MFCPTLSKLERRVSRQLAGCVVLAVLHCARAYAGVDGDVDRIKVAAEHGFVHDEVALGEAYFTGSGVEQNLKLAAHWYEKAAGSGDPAAMNQLGYFYQTGMGVKADAARAAHWYQLAASSGLLRAKVNLGVAYLFGSGVAQSTQTAEQLFKEAARAGDATASSYLGDMYYFGVGVNADKQAGEGWYEKGVKAHDYLAQYRMGAILSDPQAGKMDLPRALTLLHESATQGYVPAMHAAAVLMLNHPEVGGTREQAVAWLHEAADAGTWKSSVVLGVLARDGHGEPKNAEKAYANFRIALAEGGEQAKAMLRNDFVMLSRSLSGEQRAALDREANDWMAHHPHPIQVVYKGKDRAVSPLVAALAAPDRGVHAGTLIPMDRNKEKTATR